MPIARAHRSAARVFRPICLFLLIIAAFGTTPGADGTTYSYSIVHHFDVGEGGFPETGLTLGADGRLYGVTCGGGDGHGTIFSLDSSGAPATVYSFTSIALQETGMAPVRRPSSSELQMAVSGAPHPTRPLHSHDTEPSSASRRMATWTRFMSFPGWTAQTRAD
jgi:uncharacterized repeat protein (TIGR03803 family)